MQARILPPRPLTNEMPTKEYYRDWYAKQSPEWKKRKQRIMRERELANKQWIADYKAERGCSECDENHPACLDFHHPNDDKEKGVANMITRSRSSIQKEIDKCIILCSNCHRKKHYEQRRKA